MKHKKELILIRHAHRDTSDRDDDNGLSERGKRQAEKLLKRFEKKVLKFKGDTVIISSPKKRCIETVEPISEAADVPITVSPLLDEQKNSETHAAFVSRLKEFQVWWVNEAPALTLICSHGDWLPVFTNLVVSREMDFEKGAWVKLVLNDDGIAVAKTSLE